ncbi:hypothetical protein BH11PLA1_BH11PLA1_15740 [soil metagenome]
MNVAKVVEAAAVLLEGEPGQAMNFMRLLKLLYIGEREMLRAHGQTMLDDRMVAMERGPVPDGVYGLIKGEHRDAAVWTKHVKREGYRVRLVENPGRRLLSAAEVRLLNAVSAEHAAHDEWDMVEFTHRFPEWIKNDPGKSSARISTADILAAIGRSEDAEGIEADGRRRVALRHFFGEAS